MQLPGANPFYRPYLLALTAYAAFSCADASAKALGGHLSVFQIAFFVNVVAGVTLLVTRHQGERWRDFWRMERPLAVHSRAICGLLASLCGIYAFTTIPLAEAYALIFMSPFFVTAMSALFLGEKVGAWRWSAVALGFVGVLLVVKPGFQDFRLGHLSAIATGLATGTAIIILRRLGTKAKKTSILGMLLLYLIGFNLCAMAFTGAERPSLPEFGIVCFAGLCYGLGQWAFIMATRSGSANQVGLMHYSQLGWAVLFGALIFNEVPDMIALTGVFIIAAAGLVTVFRERILHRRLRIQP